MQTIIKGGTCKANELPDRTSDKALEALYRQQAIMTGVLQAPKIELLEFHGDPMSYHSFIRSFEENVEKMLHDDGVRLAHLIHLCKGEAGRAIKCCNLMDPKQGYARARRLLEQRFGDKHTITELWIKKLNEGGPRVNLQEYADELLDCYESLNALGALQEMDAQRNLLAMVTRLPVHLQNKWQDYVFDLRSRKDRRPTLKDVVELKYPISSFCALFSNVLHGTASVLFLPITGAFEVKVKICSGFFWLSRVAFSGSILLGLTVCFFLTLVVDGQYTRHAFAPSIFSDPKNV